MMETVAGFLTGLYNNYTLTADSRTDGWFMMSSVWIPIVIAVLYLLGSIYIGPAIMTNFDAMEERWFTDVYIKIVFFYNLCIGSLLLFYMHDADYSLVCQKVNSHGGRKEDRIATMLWIYHLAKLSTVIDTVIRILKKDGPGIVNMHIFHHVTMNFGTWMLVRFVPGGTSGILAVVNCWAHSMHYVLNYLHFSCDCDFVAGYFCAFVQMELIQFMVIALICIWNIATGCEYPTLVSVITLIYVSYLFMWLSPNWCRTFPNQRRIIKKKK